MYGGFATTNRSPPRRWSGSAANHEPSTSRTRAAGVPDPAMFARATASAPASVSTAQTAASGSENASASASAPEPVPRSATA